MAAVTLWQNALLWHLVISSAKSKLPNKKICVSCDTYLNFFSKGSISVKDRMVKECPAWAENGYCETYEKFMIRNCRTSCMAGGYVNGKRQLSLRKCAFSVCVDGLKDFKSLLLSERLMSGVTNGLCEHSRGCRALRFFCEHEQK